MTEPLNNDIDKINLEEIIKQSPGAAPEDIEAKRREYTGYNRPSYKKAEKHILKIIPQVSIWQAIDKYALSIALGLFSLGFANIFKQGNVQKNVLRNPTTLLLGGTALGTALLGVYAHYKAESTMMPAKIAMQKGYTKATADLTGQAITDSLRPYLNLDNEKIGGDARKTSERAAIGNWTQAVTNNSQCTDTQHCLM